jgi:Xaa-Pro aminopeptidase
MSEALVLYGSPETWATLRHEVPLVITDPLLFAEVDGRKVVLTTFLESARIGGVMPEAEIVDFFDRGLKELILDEGMEREAAVREVAARTVTDLGIDRAVVPGDFPLALADRLRELGVAVAVDDAVVSRRRRAKTGHELDGVIAAQRAAEAGMAAAAAVLREAEPGPDGLLVRGGAPLLAEDVRAALRAACAEQGSPAPETVIVASVRQGTGHEPGSGPLPAGLPIQVDLWPRHEASGCWADMTRTFVVGEPAAEHAEAIAEQERLVRAALEEARAMARPGVTGRELYDATAQRFEDAGFKTQRTGPDPEHPEAGFMFSLGHGVGLEVHEDPGLGLAGRDPLVPGDVLAVEPGLWDPEIGGVRYEDLLLVTEDGCETLTRYPYDLTP